MGNSWDRGLARLRLVRRQTWLLVALLLGTAGTYLVNLIRIGWANAFYAAAVQAGTVSWKAFLFGSSDGANSITVDKPPASLWPMELSARIFGLSSASMLVPQVLMAVASVWLLHRIVSRDFGAAAGLTAGLVFALTPIAVVMFRYNNPDALLVLLEIAATGALLQAVRTSSIRWLFVSGALVGLALLTKQLAAALIVPGLALTWLVAGGCSAAAGWRAKLLARIRQSLVALAGIVVGAGWWIALVELWPKADRPWIGGSQHNSFVELALGYNGLGRLNGDEVGSTRESMHEYFAQLKETCLPPDFKDPEEAGWLRLLSPEVGGQIGWLLPAALLLAVVAFVLLGRAPRTDPRRAQLIAWTGWLLVSGAVFSEMQGIFHPYYTVAIAPPIAALVGIGVVLLWQRRERLSARGLLAVSVIVTAVTAWVVLGYYPDFHPWLKPAVAGVAATAAGGVLMLTGRRTDSRLRRALTTVPSIAAAVAAFAGPVALIVDTLTRSADDMMASMPSAGPWPGGYWGSAGQYAGWDYPQFVAHLDEGCFGGPDWFDKMNEIRETGHSGGLLDASKPDPELVALLNKGADSYVWAAAVVGSEPAAGYQLATRHPVMPLGGFNGSDPSPTLAQFQQYVTDHRVHYYLVEDDILDQFSLSDSAKAIDHWAKDGFTVQKIDGVDIYDLTKPKS